RPVSRRPRMYWRRECGPPRPCAVPSGRAGLFSLNATAIDEAFMSRKHIAHIMRTSKLTDEEAVTLRRVAFGQSGLRTLRQADLETLLTLRRGDLERLLALRLIAGGSAGPDLGREHLDSLPRAVFAGRLR